MQKIQAWGAPAASKPLAPMTIERREPGARDIVLDILFCGVCHSDIHQARDEWSGGLFPMVRRRASRGSTAADRFRCPRPKSGGIVKVS